MSTPTDQSISVVIATYNRGPALVDLLQDLAQQDLKRQDLKQQDSAPFDVILIDDGSEVPAAKHIEGLDLPYPLLHKRQDNTGQAGARDHGVREAKGDIIVILDDDMRVAGDFLRQHRLVHESGFDVVLGNILEPEDRPERSLHERFHMWQLKKQLEGFTSGRVTPIGVHLCTGNVSFTRRLYNDVGGFDRSLLRSEDRELGVRFERAGARIAFGVNCVSLHKSDHDSQQRWKERAFNYGRYDTRIADKHEEVESADPWRFFFQVSPISRPLLAAAVLSPALGEMLSKAAYATSEAVDNKSESLALKGVTLVYGLEYFRGLRVESGSLLGAARRFGGYLQKRAAIGEGASTLRFAHAVREDFAALQSARKKYHNDPLSLGALPGAFVKKIGFQMTTSLRAMRLLRDSPLPLGGQLAARAIRHLYGAEIHWDTEIEPGLCIVHGNGLVLSHRSHIGAGCILFHNVTLGEGRHPETGEVGAPYLEDNVHVGPGAVLLGPIRIGEGSKIMANCVVTEDVPPNSVVMAPSPEVKTRTRNKASTPRVVRGGAR